MSVAVCASWDAKQPLSLPGRSCTCPYWQTGKTTTDTAKVLSKGHEQNRNCLTRIVLAIRSPEEMAVAPVISHLLEQPHPYHGFWSSFFPMCMFRSADDNARTCVPAAHIEEIMQLLAPHFGLHKPHCSVIDKWTSRWKLLILFLL